jgi:hypothetical protein
MIFVSTTMKRLSVLSVACLLTGCVFGASIDEVSEETGNNSNNTNNTNNSNNTNSSNNSNNTNTSNNGADAGQDTEPDVGPECDLETVLLEDKVDTPLRGGGIQADSRDGKVLVAIDDATRFLFFGISDNGAERLEFANAPVPEVQNGPTASSFDVSMISTSAPLRLLLATSRVPGLATQEGVLEISVCNVEQEQCVTQTTTRQADSGVQTAFMPEMPPAVVVGYSYDADGLATAEKRTYSSTTAVYDGEATLAAGYVFVSGDQGALGVDFSLAAARTFHVSGALGTKAFSYVSDRREDPLPDCGFALALNAKTKTSVGTPNTLFNSSMGLLLSDCVDHLTLASAADRPFDFDVVPVDGGEFVAWTEGVAAERATRGAVVIGGNTHRLTFREAPHTQHFVRLGRIGSDVVLVMAGAQEGVVMIRGTVEELVACYGD